MVGAGIGGSAVALLLARPAPNLGQGANCALEDAAALVAELCAYGQWYPALDRYSRRRLPVVSRCPDRADLLARVATPPDHR